MSEPTDQTLAALLRAAFDAGRDWLAGDEGLRGAADDAPDFDAWLSARLPAVERVGVGLARVAYEAYGVAVGGVNMLGVQLPPWDGLSARDTDGWLAAADAVARELAADGPVVDGEAEADTDG